MVHGASGDFALGFALQFTHQDVLQAKLDAILHGLQLCADRNLRQVEVEIDSAMAYNMILKRPIESWRYIYTIRQIRCMLAEVLGLILIMREANRVAHGLSKWAHGLGEKNEVDEILEVLPFIRKLIFIDRIGLPYFCSKCNYGRSFSLLSQQGLLKRLHVPLYFNKILICLKKKY